MLGVQSFIDRDAFIAKMVSGDVSYEEMREKAGVDVNPHKQSLTKFVALFECYSEDHGNEEIGRAYRNAYLFIRKQHPVKDYSSNFIHIAALGVLYSFYGWVAFNDGGKVKFKIHKFGVPDPAVGLEPTSDTDDEL